MDFHLFFCCCNVAQLHGMLSDKERTIIKPLWQVTPNCNPSARHCATSIIALQKGPSTEIVALYKVNLLVSKLCTGPRIWGDLTIQRNSMIEDVKSGNHICMCLSMVQAPDDEWEEYMLVYMEAIRAKFYPMPKQAAQVEQPAEEHQALPAPLKAA